MANGQRIKAAAVSGSKFELNSTKWWESARDAIAAAADPAAPVLTAADVFVRESCGFGPAQLQCTAVVQPSGGSDVWRAHFTFDFSGTNIEILSAVPLSASDPATDIIGMCALMQVSGTLYFALPCPEAPEKYNAYSIDVITLLDLTAQSELI